MKKWSENRFFDIANRVYISNQSRFLSLLDNNDNAKLLDIGCNNGNFTLEIAKAVNTNKVFGLELNFNMAKEAYARGIEVITADLNKPFPFASDYFDIVTTNQIIEHLYNTDNFFTEINRILRRGGRQ